MKKGLLMVVCILFVFTSCNKAPIRIGFIGDLSTKNAQLAIDARNALLLGIDEVNANGGVDGRQLELIIKDDGADMDNAILRHDEFKEAGIEFVIGHLNSNMAEPVFKSQGPDLLFMSPSMSADVLNDQDDYILRTAPINSLQALEIFNYCQVNAIDEMVVVYDLMNEEYTKSLYLHFKEIYEADGFTIKGAVAYDSRTESLSDVVKQIEVLEPKHLFCISQATDTAYMMQALKPNIPELEGYTVSWSMTKDLIQNGGSFVEGMKFIGIHNPEVKSEALTNFEAAYESQYNYEPSFISVLTYDAFTTLIKGFEEAEDISPYDVKKAILDNGVVVGLNETFTMDANGDCNRSYMLYTLEDGEFVPYKE